MRRIPKVRARKMALTLFCTMRGVETFGSRGSDETAVGVKRERLEDV